MSYNLTSSLSLEDVAPILSSILDIEIPFSNLGCLHPWFVFSNSTDVAFNKHLDNLKQINTYVYEICQTNKIENCDRIKESLT